jgi:nitroreductase
MEFQQVVRKRRMVRAFDSTPLPRGVVERIVRNAQRGPSSGFTQGFEFLIFDGPEMTAKFWQHIASQEKANPAANAQVISAPLIVVPLAHSQAYVRRYLEPDKSRAGRKTAEDWPAPYWFIDTAFAAMIVLLTAVDSGLGAYYFSLGATNIEIPPFQKAFDIPQEYYPIGAIAIGYPLADSSSPSLKRGRRPKAEVMHFGRW